MNTPNHHDADLGALVGPFISGQLRALRRVPGFTGSLVATMDGKGLVNDLNETTPGAAAAITASSLGLASRLAELTGETSVLQELQVRSTNGYVCLYIINPQLLLTILTNPSANLARLKLEVRDVVKAIDKYWGSQGLAALKI